MKRLWFVVTFRRHFYKDPDVKEYFQGAHVWNLQGIIQFQIYAAVFFGFVYWFRFVLK